VSSTGLLLQTDMYRADLEEISSYSQAIGPPSLPPLRSL